MAKPTAYPDIPSLHRETEVYTQRRRNIDPPANYKFTMQALSDFLASEFNLGASVTVNLDPLDYVPTSNGNMQNRNEVVIASNGTIWYIDGEGRAKSFNETAGDIEITDTTKGLIQRSVSGKRFRRTVDDYGATIHTEI